MNVNVSCPKTVSDTIALNMTLTNGPLSLLLNPGARERVFFDNPCQSVSPDCCTSLTYATFTTQVTQPVLDGSGRYYVDLDLSAIQTYNFAVFVRENS